MPIRGLANQWKNRDALLNRFASSPTSPERTFTETEFALIDKYTKIRKLLELLDTISESEIFIGTSHSTLNFSNRDVISESDRTVPFAFVDLVKSPDYKSVHTYRLHTRLRTNGRPTTQWQIQHIPEVDTVAELLVEEFHFADVPPQDTGNFSPYER